MNTASRYFISFRQLINQIAKDAMLIMATLAPILLGLFIKYLIPYIETLLVEYFEVPSILQNYYLIFDLFLATLSPIMFSFIAAMVILGEIDDKISNYMAVTPLGTNGYLFSRIGISSVIGFVVTILAVKIFALTSIRFTTIIGLSLLSAMIGIIVGFMVVSLSTNKVEGMAISKLSGLIIIGIFPPFFIKDNLQYATGIIPSFWLSKFVIEEKFFYLIMGIVVSGIWMIILFKKFKKKIVL
jgi:fluoroquinolone transport system permease protein